MGEAIIGEVGVLQKRKNGRYPRLINLLKRVLDQPVAAMRNRGINNRQKRIREEAEAYTSVVDLVYTRRRLSKDRWY
jgi:hypothetical protein